MTVSLLVIWLILCGKCTPEVFLVGACVSAVLMWFCAKAMNYSFSWEARALLLLPHILEYALFMLTEIVKANVQTARVILSKEGAKPMIAHVKPDFQHEQTLTALANSITLTPGTITTRDEHGELSVHCLRPEYAEGLSGSGEIKRLRRMEGKL